VSVFIDRLTSQLNLRWAWEKVRRQASPGDVWFDELELSGFELDLEQCLDSIASEFRRGTFFLKPLRPLPYPKQKDKTGKARIRQMFYVTVRDQVAWTAVVNILGPYVDSKMPTWSYGNRLFRSIWVEEDNNGNKRRMVGHYRHASGHLYLPFGQSWPIFRRHVYLATRAMATNEKAQLMTLDEQTQEEQSLQALLSEQHRCPFVISEYWRNRRPEGPVQALYWCSLDLKSFYPSLDLEIVRNNIVEQLPIEWRSEADRLLGSMLEFRLNVTGWNSSDLKQMVGRYRRTFRHIPTGLNVAGFLANAGLLKVDMEVSKRLSKRSVAHFRFVDDHVVLAYSLADLVAWVREYRQILGDLCHGAGINMDKVQPEELCTALDKKAPDVVPSNLSDAQKRAESACRLDPQFPSPLMTKTLALVSAIARTNFMLLESAELGAITDQLEHLLLVDIPEEEMPQKTRISFAATRLSRLVEARLASSTPDPASHERVNRLQAELPLPKASDDPRSEVHRVFQLLRKVLRERPDSVRLWTRAIHMCRSTGACGISDLVEDICRFREGGESNRLAAEYLSANLLAIVGNQALIAATILRDDESAFWRKRAAREFLVNDLKAALQLRPEATPHWFLIRSWLQYCFSLYCANLLLKDTTMPSQMASAISFSEEELAIGQTCLEETSADGGPARWAWLAVRASLFRNPGPNAVGLAKLLGEQLPPSRETAAFWRFFPLDVPVGILTRMLLDKNTTQHFKIQAGWWVDALRERPELLQSFSPVESARIPGAVRRVLKSSEERTSSLYQWCARVRDLPCTDPRRGEWTALEIAHQIAERVAPMSTFGPAYIRKAIKEADDLPYIHPVNFRIPAAWLSTPKGGKAELSWDEWRERVEQETVVYVAASNRVQDRRYTPIIAHDLLFELNPVRGIGLLLYGLLRRSFDLPAIWNGPRHADVLNSLPRLLLEEMACSSWTLGFLAGCLWPRTSENLMQKRYPQIGYTAEDDTLQDPIAFDDMESVRGALAIAEQNLRKYQLSTMGDRARQLTPISVRQLTRPDWRKVFEATTNDEDTLHG
jgi:hypothetical protein